MTDRHPVLPEAEPFSADGDRIGVLCLHGFTGNPSSMRPIAEAAAAAGHAVELPRLPGHGTHIDDLVGKRWSDWTATVESAYERLAARTDAVVVAGLSMGGGLTAWMGTQHPELAGLVFINAMAESSADLEAMFAAMIEGGQELMDGVSNDVADPDVDESAYTQVALPALLSALQGIAGLQDDLATVEVPALIMHSPQDHVVPPSNSDHLAATLAGPVERMTLDRSFHVATIDFDRDRIVDAVLDFVGRTAGARVVAG